MGTWSAEFLDNDDAMDFAMLWDDFIAPARRLNPEFWTTERIVDFFIQSYFRRGLDFNNTTTAAEVLALGALAIRDNLPMVPGLKKLLEAAVSAELQPAKLREWDSPKERKRILTRLLEEIGGELQAVASPIEAKLDEWAQFSKRFPKWIEIVKAPSSHDDLERVYPDFGIPLCKWLLNDLDGLGEDVYHKAIMYRLMLLAFFTGSKLELPDEQILNLIRAAKATKGYIFTCVEQDVHSPDEIAIQEATSLANGPISITPDKHGDTRCPHCGCYFNVQSAASWDGKRHKGCGTHLILSKPGRNA